MSKQDLQYSAGGRKQFGVNLSTKNIFLVPERIGDKLQFADKFSVNSPTGNNAIVQFVDEFTKLSRQFVSGVNGSKVTLRAHNTLTLRNCLFRYAATEAIQRVCRPVAGGEYSPGHVVYQPSQSGLSRDVQATHDVIVFLSSDGVPVNIFSSGAEGSRRVVRGGGFENAHSINLCGVAFCAQK